MNRPHIMLVDDDRDMLTMLHLILDPYYEISDTTSGELAIKRLRDSEKARPDLVILDHHLNDIDGTEVQQAMLDNGIDIPVIFITGSPNPMEVAKVSSRGAANYLAKPFNDDQVLDAVAQILRQLDLRREILGQPEPPESDPTEKIIGRGPHLVEVFRKVGMAAGSNYSILIAGETGTGKSMLAEAIHVMSERRRGPFKRFNCAGVPETLMEGELFGGVVGAWTSLTKDRAGYFEAANKGTIFLDEIGDMSLSTQSKLLTVLDDHIVRKLGSTADIKVDVRVIAATHRNLAREVREGRFRADLYYRLNVFPVRMPALRERREDIPALVMHLLRTNPFRPNMPPAKISHEALAMLEAYNWPGNVRDLMNVLQRAVILSQGEIIMPEHIVLDEGLDEPILDIGQQLRRGASLDEILFTAQQKAVHLALEQVEENPARAAAVLGMPLDAFLRLRVQVEG